MTPVELADTPMTPGEPEGHDNLYPDCLPLPSAGDQAASTSPSGGAFAPPPLYFLFCTKGPLQGLDQAQCYGWCAGAPGTALN